MLRGRGCDAGWVVCDGVEVGFGARVVVVVRQAEVLLLLLLVAGWLELQMLELLQS